MVRDFDDLRVSAAVALEKYKAMQTKISARGNQTAAGDLFVFAATAELGIEWAMILQHVDDAALWFMVPFDQSPMIGTWDVEVPEFSEGGPGTLRCGRGIWIHADDLLSGSRSGFLEQLYVDKVKARLAELVDPDSDPVKTRPDVDFDPDYQEWIDEVTAAAERLEAQLREEPEVISIAGFNTAWTSSLPSRSNQAADMSMLVAETGGLAAGTNEQLSDLPPGRVIATDLPGTLVAVLDGDLIRLLYFPVEAEEAPAIQTGSSEEMNLVEWRLLPEGVIESTVAFAERPVVVHFPCGRKEILIEGGR